MTAMEQIAETLCKARAAGMSYGEYVRRNFPASPPTQANGNTRICRTCGKGFVPPTLKSGGISKNVNCEECIAKKREKNGQPPAQHFTTVYIVHCHKCGVVLETRRKPGNGVIYTCEQCKKERAREYMRLDYRKRKGVCTNADKQQKKGRSI